MRHDIVAHIGKVKVPGGGVELGKNRWPRVLSLT